jgi:uncharacterized delta-60 repeat protein
VGALLPSAAQGAAGDLDATFSGDGKQRTDFGFGAAGALATVRQPDGKIVAVGEVSSSDASDFALARYNPDGSLDASFSGDGRQTTNLGGNDGANAVALQSNGKIIVAGSDGDNFALARYNANGSLDTTFSGDGRQTTDFGAFFERANGVALQSDGKIVAVGGGGGDFALARYNPNGSLDPTFSGDGRQTTDFGGFDEATGVGLQGDGKIVVVGSDGADFSLARYNPNGTLDTTFSGDGKQTTDGVFFEATGVALRADGKILVGGTTGSDFALARYTPNGSLDTTFSGDGKQTTDFGTDFDKATGVALQADGKVVAVGFSNGRFALARYTINGLLDTTFSGDGKQTTDFGSGFDEATGVALQADGRIVAVGFSGFGGGRFALARYNPNGTLDTTFSGDGKQTTSFPGFDEATGVAVQGDGKVVAVGGTGADEGCGANDLAIARYTANGSLDPTFSGDGRQTTDFGESDGAAGVALQGDGKIMVVGRTGGSQCSTSHHDDFALARYNPNGSLDATFSGDGKLTTDFGGDFDGAAAVAVQADGKIVVVGVTDGGGALARYNPNGSLDTAFSADGKQTADFSANAVAIQANGRIVVLGGGTVARYNSNGSLDTSFSGDGKQATGFAGFGVAIQADGRIVAVGIDLTAGDFEIARFNPNGSFDTTFSGDGKQSTDFGGFDGARGVAIQADGKIIASGFAGGGPTDSDFALVRFNPNGALDTSFSGDGRKRMDFGGSDRANAVALQGAKIVAAGIGFGIGGTRDFALARFLGN